jgi:hypothetical protein
MPVLSPPIRDVFMISIEYSFEEERNGFILKGLNPFRLPEIISFVY